MKLFGNMKKNLSEEKPQEESPMIVTAPVAENPGKLVLDIEGGMEEPVKEEAITLKAATSELPVQQTAELADQMAGEQIVLKTATDEIPVHEIAEMVDRLIEEPTEAAPAEEPAPETAAEEADASEPEAPAEEVVEDQSAEAADEEPEMPEASEAPEMTESSSSSEPSEESETPETPAEQPLASMTYESVAEAIENAAKEPTGRFSRDVVDDETLLAELYALIGDPDKKTKPAPITAAAGENPVPSRPAPRPGTRITPQDLQAAPEEFEELQEDDSVGVPGWLKGVFILLIALLLSAMTIYAVASDVIGEIF